MQINADTVKEHIEGSSLVVIMAHSSLDLDALGSSLGLYYLCKTIGKNACLLIEDTENEAGVERSLNEIRKQKINVKIRKFEDIENKLDDNTLLIIVDTHVPNLLQNEAALKINKKIIIDHHVQNNDNNIPTIYEYISEEQSSSVEIIIELLKHLDIYIHPYIATVMLAGIFIDTNDFFNKTSYKTHEAAAYLYQSGALLGELQYLLKEDMKAYNDQQQIIKDAKLIGSRFIIAKCPETNIYNKEDLAKISDKMLLFNDIEASFSIGKIDDKAIGISARSLGNVSVQKLMESLGGGGHLTDAATQLESETVDTAFAKLEKIVNDLEVDI